MLEKKKKCIKEEEYQIYYEREMLIQNGNRKQIKLYIRGGISTVEDYNNKLSFLCKFDYFPLQTIAKLD